MVTVVKSERNLKSCVQALNDEEKRVAIAYLMAISTNQPLFLQDASPRLFEFSLWADLIQKQESRDKLSAYLIQQLDSVSPKSRIRAGRTLSGEAHIE
jgi:hypothetical protein